MKPSANASLVLPRPSDAAGSASKPAADISASDASSGLPVKLPVAEPLLPFAPRLGKGTSTSPGWRHTTTAARSTHATFVALDLTPSWPKSAGQESSLTQTTHLPTL